VLGAGPSVVGLLYTAPAVGAVIGSLTSGWTGRLRRSGQAIFVLMAVSAAGLVGAGLTATVAVALFGLAAHGFGDALTDIVRYATVQKHTPDEYRGRFAAVWAAQVTAGASVGAVVAGGVATLVPISAALPAYGAVGLVVTALLGTTLQALRRLDEGTSHERVV
ncbi:MAG: MFS transporter, partial [Rhodococcus sp. (in: high G+C Gram-positive bacteria)]|nr:MFS transporter [Rhodococcus sp. (in: high G+C Gram-positive bacteria)]MDX5453159.1 MFS transporter [Rhodococcus sp. (in: high G+C Gram-positive bacteria)]